MKRSKYTDEQFISAIKQYEAGTKTPGHLSKARDCRADVLQVEFKIWWTPQEHILPVVMVNPGIGATCIPVTTLRATGANDEMSAAV